MVEQGNKRSILRQGGTRPKRVAARAYLYAEGAGPQPDELRAAAMIDLFGVEAVYGAGEIEYVTMRNILIAKRIEMIHDSRARSDDWAKWAQEHAAENDELNAAMKAAEEIDG